MAGITGGAGGPGMDAADLFAQFFTSGHPMFGFDFGPDIGTGRRAGKGDDSVIPHEVTLEDLYNGKSVKINMEKDVVCSQCKGCVLFFCPLGNEQPLYSKGPEQEGMQNQKHVRLVAAKGGHLRRRGFVRICMP
jgi:hypothetical protein